MKNKLEIYFIVDADDNVSVEINAHLKGFEMKAATLMLIDNISEAVTKTPVEKLTFLKAVQDTMKPLILMNLLDDIN
ncbi:MAG: hypothetical protein K2G63_01430 [Oscillospiraceae bacterium]|nr:hypothetical protein [Oscillospiraceae bacterium]